MSTHTPYLTQEFGIAVCERLGLDPEKVSYPFAIAAGENEVLTITLNVRLTPDDLRAIAGQMDKGRAK